RKPMSLLVEKLHYDLAIETVGDNSIRIAYQTGDPKDAKEVVARVVAAFLENESNSAKAVLQAARAFGKQRLEQAEQAVKDADDALKDFAGTNAALMPLLLARRQGDALAQRKDSIGPLGTADLASLLRYREQVSQQLEDLKAGRSLNPSEREIK